MEKLAIYSGISNSNLRSRFEKRNSNNISFSSTEKERDILTKGQKPLEDNKKQNEEQKHQKMHMGRKVIDAFTVSAYAALIMSAIAIKAFRKGIVKDVEKLTNNKKAGRVLKDEILLKAKILKGECHEGGPLYKVFDYFGKKKENGAELLNNLVYGFGTLVIMPLVILFSPFGRKDASKEDRTFTVLRQPISFATVFAAQYTFDKVFKGIIPELNKFGLLDGAKYKGKELYFSDDRMYEVVQENLKKSNHTSFSFNKDALQKFKNLLPATVIEHIEGSNKEFIDGDSRIPVEIKAKGNNFTLEEFTDSIISIIKDMGEKPIEAKKIQGTNKKNIVDKIDNLKKLLSHYIEEIPDFAAKLENMAYSKTRGGALKEASVIIANAIISQALGIMMLNYVYGKMMKKYAQLKGSGSSKNNEVRGGAK